MKIALLAPLKYPIREPFHGGLEMHTHLLARELTTRGHELTLFAHPDSAPEFRLRPQPLSERAGFLATALAYRKAVQDIALGGFDVVHNNSIHFLPPLLATTLNCQVITTLHTPPYRSLRWAGRLVRSKQHRFVSISQHLHDTWQPYVGEHEVIHNGLDLRTWPFSDTAKEGTAVWYGRFSPEKGAEYAIAAAREANIHLSLAGPIYDQAYFDREIAPHLGDRIQYLGHLNQATLATLIGQSEIGIVTSIWDEPFGLVYAEMLACGTPVAAFASGAVKEILTDTCGAIVPKRDVRALTQVLTTVKSKDRKACRERVVTAFPVAKMVERYLAVY
ncbi:MAG: glycosyltransferase [Bacteroidota bacterium]